MWRSAYVVSAPGLQFSKPVSLSCVIGSDFACGVMELIFESLSILEWFVFMQETGVRESLEAATTPDDVAPLDPFNISLTDMYKVYLKLVRTGQHLRFHSILSYGPFAYIVYQCYSFVQDPHACGVNYALVLICRSLLSCSFLC